MLLENKTAVIYGAGGSIGAAVAHEFAREGASVFVTGRTLATVEAVAEEIRGVGGVAEAEQVDAMDERTIDEHAGVVAEKVGGIDVSFNAISIRGDLQGTPLVDMSPEDFTLPILTGATTHFLTAQSAARQMVEKGTGVILTLSTTAARLSSRDRRFHPTGGFGVACGAIEALTKQLAAELGPQGIRVVCLRPDAIPETWPDDNPDYVPDEDDDRTVAELQAEVRANMEGGTLLGRMPTLKEVAHTATFMASDRASAITGTVTNLSCGSVVD